MYRAGTAGTFKVPVCLNECSWVCSGGSLGLHVGLLWTLAVLLLLLLMLLLLMLLLLLLAMLSPPPPPLALPTLTVLLITSLPQFGSYLAFGLSPCEARLDHARCCVGSGHAIIIFRRCHCRCHRRRQPPPPPSFPAAPTAP